METPKKAKGRNRIKPAASPFSNAKKKKKKKIIRAADVPLMFAKKKGLQSFDPLPNAATLAPGEHFRDWEVPEHAEIMRYSYSWDLALVFEQPRPKGYKDGDEHILGQDLDAKGQKRQNQIANYVRRLEECGLKYMLYHSVMKTHIICLVGGSEDRLRQWAGLSDYDVMLNSDEALKQAVAIGIKLAQQTATGVVDVKKWANLYGPFNLHDVDLPDRYKLYHVFDNQGVHHPNTVFMNSDRIKLTLAIMQGPAVKGGGALTIDKDLLAKSNALQAVFPLHCHTDRRELKKKMFAWTMLRDPPLDDVTEYLGEEIGLYFAFLSHYVKLISSVAVIGTIIFIWQIYEGTVDIIVFPIMGILVVPIWSTIFLETWKQREACLVAQWGMSEFLEKEERRPEFVGDEVINEVTGEDDLHFNTSIYALRQFCSQSLIFLLCVTVGVMVSSIFLLRSFLTTAFGKSLAGPIVAVINAILIMVLNAFWSMVSRKLNDWENHRTKSAYNSALITKSFVFKAINSYASLFYIAFVKQYDLGCNNDDCLGELQIQLALIYAIQIVVNNALEIFTPWFSAFRKRRKVKMFQHSKTDAESEFEMEAYASTFFDYDELSIQFGYLTLFVAAFPLAPLVSFFALVLEGRLDATKLLMFTQRPVPQGCATIGQWANVLRIVSYVSILTNTLLVLAHSNRFQFDIFEAFIVFILIEHVIVLAKVVAELKIPDVPFHIQQAVKRQTLLVNYLIRGMDVQHKNSDVTTSKKTQKVVMRKLANVPAAPVEVEHFMSGKAFFMEKSKNDQNFDKLPEEKELR